MAFRKLIAWENKYLLKSLIIPLFLAIIFFFILGCYINWKNIFTGISITLLGILITVSYVNYIIRKQKELNILNVKERINKRIEFLANATITNFRTFFGFGGDIFNQSIMERGNKNEIKKEMIRIAENILIPASENKITKMNQNDWKGFADLNKIVWDGSDWIIRTFGQNIDSEILTLLLDIQDISEKIIRDYSIWPDILGVPDEQLLSSDNPNGIHIKRNWSGFIIKDFKKLILNIINILNKI